MNKNMDVYEVSQEITDTCGFLSMLLNKKPSEELIEHLRKNCLETLPSTTDENNNDGLTQGSSLILKYIEETKEEHLAEVAQELAVDWTRLFRGIAPGYGPLPPYEAVYIGKDSQERCTQIFLELNKEYSLHGLSVDCSCSRPDYVGVQVAFLHYLCKHEIELLNQENYKEAQKIKTYYTKFATEHLDKWIVVFCKEAEKYAKTDFFKGLLKFLPEFVLKLTDDR
ncbi:MAG: molecular chaperone TorD family protein [Eubacteriales bacterium]